MWDEMSAFWKVKIAGAPKSMDMRFCMFLCMPALPGFDYVMFLYAREHVIDTLDLQGTRVHYRS